MSPVTISLSCFGGVGLLLAWYLSTLSKSTYYRAIQPNETITPQDGREARKKDLISKLTRYTTIYMVACLGVTSIVWVSPKIKTVRAALNPTATATITLTPTVTLTRTPIPTRMTSTPRATGTPGSSPTASFTPTEKVTATPKVIIQNVPMTVIVNRNNNVTVHQTVIVPATVIVYQTVIVPATVIVYQTMVAPITYTPSPTGTPTATADPNPTITSTATADPNPTITSTPTETPAP